MSVNTGYFAVINTARHEGDTALLTHITGGDERLLGRGLNPAHRPLRIYHSHLTDMELHYPQTQKFFSGAITDFRFRYDASEVPQTVAGPMNSQAVSCTVETIIGGLHRVHNTHFVKVTNVGTLATLNPASLGIPMSTGARFVSSIVSRARQLAQTVNSQAQEMLVGALII